MIEFCVPTSALAAEPNFSASDVLNGIVSTPSDCSGPGKVWVEVDGRGDCLRFYGTIPDGSLNRPVIFFEGDAIGRNGKTDAGQTVWGVPPYYTQLSPSIMQAEAEQYGAATHRPFINLARPGIYGSSGNHLERRRKREVDLVNAAVDRLKDRFGWDLISLAGLSGGGHLVGALLARRMDVDCAVIASGNVAVRRRLQELGLAADVTGFTDFIDPVDDVGEVARHPQLIHYVDRPDGCGRNGVIATRLLGGAASGWREGGAAIRHCRRCFAPSAPSPCDPCSTGVSAKF